VSFIHLVSIIALTALSIASALLKGPTNLAGSCLACKARIGLAHIIHCLLVPRLTLKALVISSSKALLDAHFASFASIAKEWQALGSLAVESGTALLSGLSGSRTLQGKGGRRQFSLPQMASLQGVGQAGT